MGLDLETLKNNMVRDICQVSVTAAPKSKVREIVEEYFNKLKSLDKE